MSGEDHAAVAYEDHAQQRSGWHKSTYSGSNGCCVEVAVTDRGVAVRDSKDPDGARLRFEPEAWTRFLLGLKSGDFDDPSSG